MPKRDPAHMAKQSDRILDAALECFIHKGMYETSLADICQQARLSVGCIYIHFASKDDIVRAVADRQLERANGEDIPDTRYELLESLRDEMLWYGKHGGHARARVAAQLLAEAYSNTGIEALQRHWIDVTRQLLCKIFHHLEQKREIALPLGVERTADALISLETGIILTALREQHISWEAHAATLVAVVEHLIAPGAVE